MKLFRRFALPLALILASAGALRAQDAPAPVPVARVSIASLDAVNKLIADLGLTGIPPLKSTLESSFPFLGEGSVDSTKPLGVVVLATNGQPLTDPGIAVFAVPLNDGKDTVATLTAAGATAVPGSTDTLTGMGHTLRRSAAYLFAREGTNPAGLAALTDDLFSSDYKKDSGNLAVITLHLKEFRTAAPDAYKQAMAAPALMNVPADSFAPVAAALEKIDRLTFAIATDDKNIHLRDWISPSPWGAKSAKQAPRPTFPTGTILQVHFVFPDAETASIAETGITSFIDQNKDFPAPMKPAAEALVKRICKIISGADVFSVGVNMKNDQPVIYLVSQMNQDFDAATELKAAGDDIVALAKQMNPTGKLTAAVSTYDAGGKTVQRLTLDDGTPQPGIVDVIQDGKKLYITVSQQADKMVGDLAACPAGPESNLLCAGAIDLTALVNAAGNGNGPLSMLKPDSVQELKTAVLNQGITWTVQISDSNFLYTDVSIPTPVIKEIVKIAGGFMGGM